MSLDDESGRFDALSRSLGTRTPTSVGLLVYCVDPDIQSQHIERVCRNVRNVVLNFGQTKANRFLHIAELGVILHCNKFNVHTQKKIFYATETKCY